MKRFLAKARTVSRSIVSPAGLAQALSSSNRVPRQLPAAAGRRHPGHCALPDIRGAEGGGGQPTAALGVPALLHAHGRPSRGHPTHHHPQKLRRAPARPSLCLPPGGPLSSQVGSSLGDEQRSASIQFSLPVISQRWALAASGFCAEVPGLCQRAGLLATLESAYHAHEAPSFGCKLPPSWRWQVIIGAIARRAAAGLAAPRVGEAAALCATPCYCASCVHRMLRRCCALFHGICHPGLPPCMSPCSNSLWTNLAVHHYYLESDSNGLQPGSRRL